MPAGNTHGLTCPICGDPCRKPVEHLAREDSASALLMLDEPCEVYAEVNKWGHRWRVMKVLRGGKIRAFVDDMGDDESFTTPVFFIDSFVTDAHGNHAHPSEWNTVGECFDLAQARHDLGARQRRGAQRATGKAWAEEIVNQYEEQQAWVRSRSTFGPMGHLQRDRSATYGPGGYTRNDRRVERWSGN